jgi:amidohydrolase
MMLRDGVLNSPKVDMSLSLHLWNEKPLGWLGIAGGPVMAGAEIFTVRITGKGGHGAIPQQTIDPVVAAAQIVMQPWIVEQVLGRESQLMDLRAEI